MIGSLVTAFVCVAPDDDRRAEVSWGDLAESISANENCAMELKAQK